MVFINDGATAQYDGNYLYVYKEKVTKNSDGYEVDVILADGSEPTTVTIDEDTYTTFTTGTMKMAAGMYAYSVSDDVYSLTQSGTPATFIKGGVITASKSDYITVGASYTLTDSTVVAYGATNKTASVGEALNTGDTVSFVINEDDEVEFAVITRYAGDVLVNASASDIADALSVSDEVEVSGALTGSITVPASKTLILTGNVSGTPTLTGSGTVELKDVAVDGTLDLTSVAADFKGSISVESGATLTFDESYTPFDATLTVKAGATMNDKSNVAYKDGLTEVIEAGATVKLNDTDYIVASEGSGVILLSAGNVTITENHVVVNGTAKLLNAVTITVSGDVFELADGATLDMNSKAFTATNNNNQVVFGNDVTVNGFSDSEQEFYESNGSTEITSASDLVGKTFTWNTNKWVAEAE